MSTAPQLGPSQPAFHGSSFSSIHWRNRPPSWFGASARLLSAQSPQSPHSVSPRPPPNLLPSALQDRSSFPAAQRPSQRQPFHAGALCMWHVHSLPVGCWALFMYLSLNYRLVGPLRGFTQKVRVKQSAQCRPCLRRGQLRAGAVRPGCRPKCLSAFRSRRL